MSPKRTVLAAAGVAAAVAGGVVLHPSGAGAAAGRPDPLQRFYSQPVTWTACQRGADDADGRALDAAGVRCAGITVPLDYARPERGTTTVAIARATAADPPNRIGSLVFNLGGPAIATIRQVPLAAQALGERFDVVGMDLRFAGRSAPFDCKWDTNWLPRSAGASTRSFARMTALSATLAAQCGRNEPNLAFASTAATVRDLDVVRAALGEQKLSYLGYSQGTLLGAQYAQLFPQRVDRMVLDSAIDPAKPGTLPIRDDGPIREAALHGWAERAAAHDDVLGLGATPEAVFGVVEQIYAASAKAPLRVGRFTMDDTVLAAVLSGMLADDSEQSDIDVAEAVTVLAKAAAGEPVEPTEVLAEALSGQTTGEASAFHSVQTAILCNDAPVSRNPLTYLREVQANRAAAPIFNPQAFNIGPCAFWPVRPAAAPIRVHNAVPALVVNADGDIDANLPGATALHRALTGSRMVVAAGVRTHGVFLFKGVTCVDDLVLGYLASGQLPAADTTICPKEG